MRTVVGVMGGAVVDELTLENARRIGELIAEHGWVLLNGGRNAGVMAASAEGASEAGGLVVGLLPGDTTANAAPHVDVAIPTGLGDARNAINVLASHAVVALPGGAGTVSEVALALKAGRCVVMLGFPLGVPFNTFYDHGQLADAATPEEAIEFVARVVGAENDS